MVERGEDVYIPDGNFILRAKDEISVVGSVKNSVQFFKKLGVPTTRAKNAFIVGGGETAYYLAKQLISIGIAVKIVEKDKARCEELSELLPQAMDDLRGWNGQEPFDGGGAALGGIFCGAH